MYLLKAIYFPRTANLLVWNMIVQVALTNDERTHINNIVHLPSGEKFSADVAFGGDGPTSALAMNYSQTPVHNLGTQEVRVVHDMIPKQRLREPKLWIYQYRNDAQQEWNSFYSFCEVEFFQEDFEVQNWWTSAKTLHRWTVLVVRFLRQGEPIKYPEDDVWRQDKDADINVVGKVMLVNNVVKVNTGGKTQVVHQFNSEAERLTALREYFGILLTTDEEQSIDGWDMALEH